MTAHCTRCAVGLIVLLIAPVARAGPRIGEKAPAVKVAEWVARKPPALPGEKGADKHVFLVEFWATWCPPCKKSIPHLAELHARHEKEGLLILGISNEEPEVVKSFIEKKKVNMPYFVGIDDEMATNNVWMADVEGIPHCYVVDKSNTIVWQGNPLDTSALDHVLKEVLAGRFDAAAAKTAAAAGEKYDEAMKNLQAAFAARDEAKVFELLDQMIALKPRDLHAYLIKRQLLATFEKSVRIPEWDERILAAFNDDADSLVDIVRIHIQSEITDRNPAVIWKAARRADALAKGRDPHVLALVAEVQAQFGMIEQAVETQRRAVSLAPADEVDSFRKVHAYYRAVEQLRREALPEPAPNAVPGHSPAPAPARPTSVPATP